ncbi:hemin uptake protein HemP [Rhodocyclus tenuis]|uniref:Hemin uptake protein HemP n=1 Tax=Rhodocyclus tenuis TaxID=1066 RepID=A0A840G3M0_RHOTE|nr:hemin uptake protein HemP [Rhodocyclus tenuis]MBB4246993.1 hemin uptake protein HemP [Rhodocyclus tenuis]
MSALAAERKAIDSRLLLGNSDEIVIRHMGAEYRLRQTRQGKLILTK